MDQKKKEKAISNDDNAAKDREPTFAYFKIPTNGEKIKKKCTKENCKEHGIKKDRKTSEVDPAEKKRGGKKKVATTTINEEPKPEPAFPLNNCEHQVESVASSNTELQSLPHYSDTESTRVPLFKSETENPTVSKPYARCRVRVISGTM